MSIDYIIVQAGGSGTRLRHLTENKPKALVSINNCPMIFHLFNKYPNKKFIIISDYKIDVMRLYLNAFANVRFMVVDSQGEKGTCAGLKRAISLIPENESFMLVWSDLILSSAFELPLETHNYLGISQNFECRWSYCNEKFDEITSKIHGVAGLFIFINKKTLERVPVSGEFVKWLQSQNYIFQLLNLEGTVEYGELSKYCEENQSKKCRPFNKISFEEGYFIKEPINRQGEDLSKKEVAWYQFSLNAGYKNIPKIFSYVPLKMEKINGENIFEYNFTIEEKKILLTKIVKAIKNLHELKKVPTDYFSIFEAYITKTMKRINTVRDLIPFADKPIININGKQCRNIFYNKDLLLKKIEKYSCKEFSFIHGDITFSNMLLDDNKNPIFIDPRGYFGFTDLYGDENYDWAKLYYSIVGNYDQFNMGKFRLSFSENSVVIKISSNHWEELEEFYFQLLGDSIDRSQIKLIHGIIWLSLSTYAWDDYDSVCGAFYMGLYYLESML